MDRRTLLKSAAAVAVGAPLASLATATSARAAGTYHVAVCEQLRNQILIHPVGPVDWSPASRLWRWQAPATSDWALLSDIKFRETTAFGWVALVTASGGRVGIVNMGDGDELLWSAAPNGNPHAIERIPGISAVVTASAESSGSIDYPGFLTVYGPTNSDDPSTLTKVQEITTQGAHGLWYDGNYLWALGTWTITKYQVTGSHLTTRLVKVWGYTFPTAFNGHSLDADYSDPAYLLLTGGGSVQRLNKASGALTRLPQSDSGVKSFSRIASGESFWQQASGSGDNWWNSYIQFFDSAGAKTFTRSLEGYGYEGRFYKARLSSVNFS
ncbi:MULTISPECIES: hypothetical protein [unclassified Streptomyces]|uniref:hypothetical protein n=1 Tax=unclassified Streptomyces TaxID=2593676 RepID=UPI002E119F9C|nr:MULTISPECIES: hypothetical protein [unclassified Streptomyces]WSR29462.1 hypothetical protein OG573_43640 [Streptomyces sp. NBC_01205]